MHGTEPHLLHDVFDFVYRHLRNLATMADFNLLREVQTDRNHYHGSPEGKGSKSPPLSYWERRSAEKTRPQNKRRGRNSPSRPRPTSSVKVSFGEAPSQSGSAKARKSSVMAAASAFEHLQVKDAKKYRTISPRDGAVPPEVLAKEESDSESEEETVDLNDKVGFLSNYCSVQGGDSGLL